MFVSFSERVLRQPRRKNSPFEEFAFSYTTSETVMIGAAAIVFTWLWRMGSKATTAGGPREPTGERRDRVGLKRVLTSNVYSLLISTQHPNRRTDRSQLDRRSRDEKKEEADLSGEIRLLLASPERAGG
jgi:hypothetical protein